MSERGHFLHANCTPQGGAASFGTPGFPLEVRVTVIPAPIPSRVPA